MCVKKKSVGDPRDPREENGSAPKTICDICFAGFHAKIFILAIPP